LAEESGHADRSQDGDDEGCQQQATDGEDQAGKNPQPGEADLALQLRAHPAVTAVPHPTVGAMALDPACGDKQETYSDDAQLRELRDRKDDRRREDRQGEGSHSAKKPSPPLGRSMIFGLGRD
jgi:hypothetical protein